ncbi:nuclear protein 96-domain-containing protein [Phycomyces nitens]|nr:nuclear protein 96-domain-containing protein [Phycomyces nitens]
MLSIKRPFDAPESTSKKLAVSPKNSPDVASIYTSIINFTRQHSTIESTKNPHAHLDIPKPTSLLTDLIKKSHLSNSSPNEYKALELCDLLLNTEPSNLIDKFYKWMNSFCRDASAEITAFESKYPRDPWAKVIIALSSGDTVKASKMAQSRGDQHLAVLLVGPEDYDVRQDSKDKIKELEQDGRFEKMSVCHQKVWYIMSGKLGYCNQHIVVVEHLEWERVLGLYVWSGVRAHQSLEHAVQLYNEALAGMPGTHYLISNKKTASPPSSCLWVSVLRLWASKMPMAVMTKERARRRSADKNILSMNDWPAGLVWILTLVVPDWFSEEKVYQFTERWCNTLQDNLLSDQAVCAALYLKSPSNREKLARSILNKCKWNDKHYLVNELCIPMLWIQEAKAIYAHSVKDYATEADWYFEANEFEKAKYAILNNLVPTTLLCGK